MKTVKGTRSHDFDTRHVLNLIASKSLEKDDAIEILCRACNVIGGLRERINQLNGVIRTASKVADKKTVFEL